MFAKIKTLCAVVGYAAGCLLVFFGGLKILDDHVLKSSYVADAFGHAGGPRDPRTPQRTVNMYDLYPFTGGHTQANFSLYDGRVTSGKHGFNTDVDVDNPPPKKGIRIIWTGGSAAWGWGAADKAHMTHNVVERALTSRCGQQVEIINLAMNGSHSLQNAIALNIWGHRLNPDMIVSFSGVNDFGINLSLLQTKRERPWLSSMTYDGFPIMLGFSAIARGDADSPTLQWLRRIYPNLIDGTPLGIAIRTIFLNRYMAGELARFDAQHPANDTFATHTENLVIPQYIHAIKTIKRDFLGIPIFVIFQPYMARPGRSGDEPPLPPQISGFVPLYEHFIQATQKSLSGYLNDRWNFFDAHAYYSKNMLDRFPPGDGVHLDDEKQEIMGKVIADYLAPMACAL